MSDLLRHLPLRDLLLALGLRHRDPESRTAGPYAKEILQGDEVVFTGTAWQVLVWLRETGRIDW